MTILKEYRINNNLRQQEMADKLKCSVQSYRLYENGKITIPNRILMTFFKLRATEEDLELANKLGEIYER